MYMRAWTTIGAMEAKTKYKCTHVYVKVMLGAFTIIQLALASLASAFEDAKEEDRTAIQREALHDQVYVFVCTYAFIPRILVGTSIQHERGMCTRIHSFVHAYIGVATTNGHRDRGAGRGQHL